MTQRRKIICSSDWHADYIDKKAMAKFECALAEGTWTDYVVLGDIVDFDGISKFAAGKPGLLTRRIADQAVEAKTILNRHVSLVQRNNPDVKLHFCEGNHEYRLYDYIERNPSLAGLIFLPELLGLSDLGFSYYQSGDILKIGQVSFLHGTKCGITHGRNTALRAKTPFIIYGHTHSLEASVTSGFGGAKERAFSCGCLCSLKMDYMKKRGNDCNWEHGYIAVDINDHLVNVSQIRI
jgi:predicted phosphodiesterase